MAEVSQKKATYDDLYEVPENMIGEIIGGELIATPRPSRKHGYSTTALGVAIGGRYQFGQGGGPGGWIFIIEPEIGLGSDILVPDLAGWKSDRFPQEESHNWISIAPDWICEVLSPRTFRKDKVVKMPLYAQYGVQHFWLVDPVAKTLDVFRLEASRWLVAGLYAENDKARAEPFPEVEVDLAFLWLETGPEQPEPTKNNAKSV
jgi:Uma2 family endonuclease